MFIQSYSYSNKLATLAGAVICYYEPCTIVVHDMVATAQFKLDRTRVQHGLNMTCFTFCTHASMRVHARLMTSNLSFRALVYTLDVCTTVCRCTCPCQECTHQIWIMCMQIVSQKHCNKFYEHVNVLRCVSPHDTRHKSH